MKKFLDNLAIFVFVVIVLALLVGLCGIISNTFPFPYSLYAVGLFLTFTWSYKRIETL